jgi:succinoglycan biosynthesis protein ExoM
MSAPVRVDVGVCTFQRQSVVETLRSLGAQVLPPDLRMRVIVADNEPTPAAEARVKAAAAESGLELLYVHAPAHNICIARNAILDALDADYLAYIDDDQLAAPDWLACLIGDAEQQGCDAILGPVKAAYGPDAPAWVVAGDFHSFGPTIQGGRILKGYTCNVAIRANSIQRYGLRFQLSLGRTGGEDDDFFYQLTDAGGVIGFSERAKVFEVVPQSRTSLGWLLKRSFRTGQTHGRRLEQRLRGGGRLPQLLLAAGKGAVCLAGATLAAPFAVRRRAWLVRGALHVGVVARLMGLRELQLY